MPINPGGKMAGSKPFISIALWPKYADKRHSIKGEVWWGTVLNGTGPVRGQQRVCLEEIEYVNFPGLPHEQQVAEILLAFAIAYASLVRPLPTVAWDKDREYDTPQRPTP
jgi:hypothetical protein